MNLNLAMHKGSMNSTKDQIINVLSYDWPLKIQRIYSFLKKRYGVKITYQAVYKAVNQMLSENIILRNKEGYQLDLDWVKEVHNQTEIIRVNYFSEQRAVLYDSASKGSQAIRVFIFKTWFDVEKYLYYLQKNYLLKTREKHIICTHHAHEWRPLFYLRAEYNWIKKLEELGHKVFTLCSGNSAIDKWSAKFYDSIGSNIKLGIRCAETSEIVVFNDLVVQVYIPLELRERLDKEFKKIKAMEQISYSSLISNIFEKKAEIKVVINKDKILADQIKRQTLSKFKGI